MAVELDHDLYLGWAELSEVSPVELITSAAIMPSQLPCNKTRWNCIECTLLSDELIMIHSAPTHCGIYVTKFFYQLIAVFIVFLLHSFSAHPINKSNAANDKVTQNNSKVALLSENTL